MDDFNRLHSDKNVESLLGYLFRNKRSLTKSEILFHDISRVKDFNSKSYDSLIEMKVLLKGFHPSNHHLK